MKFGVHTSISGGIDKSLLRAEKLNCDTVQIFPSNPRGWKIRNLDDKEVEKFATNLEKYEINPVIIHATYLINLASPKEDLYNKSINALEKQIIRGDKIGAKYLVLHPGSHTGLGKEKGINRVANALNKVIAKTKPNLTILLENVAGAGTAIGSTIEELSIIYDNLDNKQQVGICLDTCHSFAAGYNLASKKELDKLLAKIDDVFGLEKLGVIHANDSKGELGNNKDRHHHIGQGEIGIAGFEKIVNHSQLQDKAFILETPIDENGTDEGNLTTIRDLVNS